MGLLVWILFGALAGWVASMIFGNNAEQGALGNIIVGIIGAMVGGFIFSALGGVGVTGFNLPSLVIATLGAVLVLFTKEKLTA